MAKISKLALARAREITGNPKLEWLYVQIGAPVVAGYALRPLTDSLTGECMDELMPYITWTVTTVPDAPLSDLHWLVVTQRWPGPVLYTWRLPGKIQNYFLAQGITEGRGLTQGTTELQQRMQAVWRASHLSKLSETAIRPAVLQVGWESAVQAAGLLTWLLQRHQLNRTRALLAAREIADARGNPLRRLLVTSNVAHEPWDKLKPILEALRILAG